MKYAVLTLTFLLVFMGAGAQRGRNGGTARTGQGAAGAPCNPSSCVCHGVLGCFQKRSICQERTAPLPESPQKIGTRFTLYKRGNRGVQSLTSNMPATALYAAGFDARRPTVIGIHGWAHSTTAFEGIKNVLLKKGDYNVILVDWEKGAGITGRWPLAYTQPVQNTRVVGKQVGMLVSHLRQVTGINLNTVHLIGASLGAHAAGYAGRYLNGTVGRISALDPAKPNFEGQPADCKLDKTDAQFVDVIHTNMDVAGIAESIGHVDFFPNGGRTQPGCSSSAICSHLRAKSYFRASIWTDCQFRTTRCDGTSCGPSGCPSMGFNALNRETASQRGNFCLTTTDRPPYCTDIKDTKPKYPGKVNPELPLPPQGGYGNGNTPQVGRGIGNTPHVGNGNDKTTWFDHGKPLNPGVQPGWKDMNQRGNNPGYRPGSTGSDTNMKDLPDRLFQGVELGGNKNNGVRHQTTFYIGFTVVFTLFLARLL